MTGAELAALITAIGVSLAGILTSIAALMNARNNADKIAALQKDNDHLRDDNLRKSQHNEYQDNVILDQQRKIDQWARWGDRIGRQLNELQLQMGLQYSRSRPNDETQPLKSPADRDWITGPLGKDVTKS
jgi:hypothetical protein